MILLAELPHDHELRTRPLAELGAQCRNLQSKEWRHVQPSWAIARVAFNDLGESWTSTTEFRVTNPARVFKALAEAGGVKLTPAEAAYIEAAAAYCDEPVAWRPLTTQRWIDPIIAEPVEPPKAAPPA